MVGRLGRRFAGSSVRRSSRITATCGRGKCCPPTTPRPSGALPRPRGASGPHRRLTGSQQHTPPRAALRHRPFCIEKKASAGAWLELAMRLSDDPGREFCGSAIARVVGKEKPRRFKGELRWSQRDAATARGGNNIRLSCVMDAICVL